MTQSRIAVKPYKGPDSYQVEDAGLFFGRDTAAAEVTGRILATGLSVVHAQSGAGKTSLLNARVIPGLETRGWSPVRVLPHNDPILSTRMAILEYVAPHPSLEAIAIRNAWQELADGQSDLTLGMLLERYDQLPDRDPRRRELIARIESPAASGQSGVVPTFARVLRSTLCIEALGMHFRAVLADEANHWDAYFPLSETTPMARLLELVESAKLQAAHEVLLRALNPPTRNLAEFVSNLFRVYGSRREHFRLVLLFDQFEELFTRFVDVQHTKTWLGDLAPDWRLRWEFFEQLRELHLSACASDTGGSMGVAPVAIRTVISLRSEYLAQLGPIREFVCDLDRFSYHLSLLGLTEAGSAIAEPAHLFGYRYAPECYQQIIQDLTKEERFIEPSHLQIVCEKLWKVRGWELSESEANDHQLEVELALYDGLGRAQGIMRAFLGEFLASLSTDDCLETLELLESLITSSGTRNIVARDHLLAAPFRNRQRRERLLHNLVGRSIVRVETRLGGYFAEITHEFLIAPILEAIRKQLYADRVYSSYRVSLRALDRFQHGSEAGSQVLFGHDFQTLHAERNRIEWTPWAVQAMFRTAIAYATPIEVLGEWAGRLLHASNEDAATVDPLKVAREFLQSKNLEYRVRAPQALAAIGTLESIHLLLDLTLMGPELVVRDAAEAALATLRGTTVEQLGRILTDFMTERQRRPTTYALLGRLRDRGMDVAIAPLSLAVEASAAWATRAVWWNYERGNTKRPVANRLVHLVPSLRRFSWAELGSSAVGATVLACLAAPLNLLQDSGAPGGMLIIWGMLGWLPAILVGGYAAPAGFYWDRCIGTMVEMLRSWPIWLVLMLPTIWAEGNGRHEWVLMVGALCATVWLARLGTVLACGILKAKRRNALAQIVVGSLCVSVPFAALFLWDVRDAGLWWVTASVGGVSLASAFARVDAAGQNQVPIAGRLSRFACIGLSIVAVGIWLIAVTRANQSHIHNAIPNVERAIENNLK